jgi:hypothetical protein
LRQGFPIRLDRLVGRLCPEYDFARNGSPVFNAFESWQVTFLNNTNYAGAGVSYSGRYSSLINEFCAATGQPIGRSKFLNDSGGLRLHASGATMAGVQHLPQRPRPPLPRQRRLVLLHLNRSGDLELAGAVLHRAKNEFTTGLPTDENMILVTPGNPLQVIGQTGIEL